MRLLNCYELNIGYLSAITRRVKELATGQWELKSIMLPLSQKMLGCGERIRIPLWRATYGSNGHILWQVNLGYDEEFDLESQMITGRSHASRCLTSSC